MSKRRKQAMRRKSREAAGPPDSAASAGPTAWWKWVLGLAAISIAVWFAWSPGSDGDADLGIPSPDLSGVERRVAEAIEAARSGVASSPLSPRAWGRLGAVLDVHHLFDPAEAAYARAQELDPQEFRWPYNLACVGELLAREPDTILAHYARATELGSGYAPLHCRLGDTLAGFGRIEEAKSAYTRALELDDQLARAHRGLGLVQAGADELESATRHLERAAELSPQDATALNALARTYARAGDGERARLTAEKAQGLQAFDRLPDSFRDEVSALGISSALCAARATALLRTGRYADALADLAIVAEVNSEDPFAHLRLGVARIRTADLDGAQASLTRALALNEDLGPAHLELGWLYSNRGGFEDAIRHLERAAQLSPDDPLTHARLGTAYLQSGDPDSVISHYSSVTGRHELNVEALLNWSQAYRLRGLLAESMRRAREALALDPDEPRCHMTVGYLSHSLHEPDQALDHYRNAIELDPDLMEARLSLGLLCEELGHLQEAAESLRHLLRIAPRHPQVELIAERVSSLEERLLEAGPAPPTDSPQRPEFEQLAAALYDGEQEYLGRAPVERLRREAADPDRNPMERASLQRRLALECVEQGLVDEAVQAIDAAFQQAARLPGVEPDADMHRLRGLVYLRRAEVQNCIQRRNADCCIFPLRGGGVHSQPAAAHEAWESYRRYLEARPGDLTARWLLNVVAMALGRYPGDVPEDLRIPSDTFAADRDLGRFPDVASRLGVDTFNLCGGVVAEDFDSDGLLDIVTSSFDPAQPLTHYRSNGQGRFDDVSARSRAADQLGGLNCVGADYDNDGDIDLLVLRGAWLKADGRIRNSLLRNDGDHFTDVTRYGGLASPSAPTQAAVWGDFDLDGDLDLYVGNESRAQWEKEASASFPSQLFRNDGEGRFVDVAEAAGVTNDRYCKGATAGDYDNDGDLDLYVSNSGPNRLYRNDGDMKFTDVTASAGVEEPGGRSFATWFFDHDNDGWLDLFVAAFDATVADIAADYLELPFDGTPPRLYRNRRDGTFEDVAAAVGLDHMYLPMGANFGDLDNDGFLDIYLTTGDPNYETLVPNVVLRNDRGERFEDVTTSVGLGHLQKGHGIAFADFDNDGDQDIYHQLGGFYPGDRFANALFLNPGHGNRFLTVDLVGSTSNRMGYGARVRVVVRDADGTREIHRAAGSVSSFGGSPSRLEIGLGPAAEILVLEISWPRSKTVQTFEEVPLDSFLRIVEDEETFSRLEVPRVVF